MMPLDRDDLPADHDASLREMVERLRGLEEALRYAISVADELHRREHGVPVRGPDMDAARELLSGFAKVSGKRRKKVRNGWKQRFRVVQHEKKEEE